MTGPARATARAVRWGGNGVNAGTVVTATVASKPETAQDVSVAPLARATVSAAAQGPASPRPARPAAASAAKSAAAWA